MPLATTPSGDYILSLTRFSPSGDLGFGTPVTSATVPSPLQRTLRELFFGYCYKIPDEYPLKAAPLLCAGITVYTHMIKHHINQPSKYLGIIGLGGLGHMAVKFGKAFGLEVTVISTSKSKKEEAIDLLLADRFLLSTDEKQMESTAKSLDFIIDTASGNHPFDPYLSLLKVDGVMVLVGFPSEIKIKPINLNFGSRCIAGSLAGGTKDTEEMLEFCTKNRVYPEVEMISIEYVNEALDRLS